MSDREGRVDPRVVAATRMQLSSWQAALGRGASRVGWKVALGFPEIEAMIGEQPVLGHVTSETLLPSGASFSLSPLRAPRVETELVVALADTIAPGAERRAVESAVAGLAVGLEIVDVGRPPDDLEGIIAANVAHRACVIGRAQQLREWRRAEARTWVNGELRQAVSVSDAWVERLDALARILAAFGLSLRAGDRVLAGSLTHVEARAGDHVVAEIEHLGSVDAHLVH